MKAYQFNERTGLFEGEIFEDDSLLPGMSGVTTIAPPEYEPGETPVFDSAGQHWKLLPVSIVRQLLLGENQ